MANNKLNRYRILRLSDPDGYWSDEGQVEVESAVRARQQYRESHDAGADTIVAVPAKFWRPMKGSQQTVIKNVEVAVHGSKAKAPKEREPASV